MVHQFKAWEIFHAFFPLKQLICIFRNPVNQNFIVSKKAIQTTH